MRLVLRLLRVLTTSPCGRLWHSGLCFPPVTVCGQDRSVRSQADPELTVKPTAASTPRPSPRPCSPWPCLSQASVGGSRVDFSAADCPLGLLSDLEHVLALGVKAFAFHRHPVFCSLGNHDPMFSSLFFFKIFSSPTFSPSLLHTQPSGRNPARLCGSRGWIPGTGALIKGRVRPGGREASLSTCAWPGALWAVEGLLCWHFGGLSCAGRAVCYGYLAGSLAFAT